MKGMDPLYVSYINNSQIGHTSINFFLIFGRFFAIFGRFLTKYRKKKFLFVSQICILRSQMIHLDPLYVSYINNIQIGHTSIKIFFQNSISENAY